jgi:hypothetical protein
MYANRTYFSLNEATLHVSMDAACTLRGQRACCKCQTQQITSKKITVWCYRPKMSNSALPSPLR